MNKHYYEAMADAAEFQARSYECEARACRLKGESRREKFYLNLAYNYHESAASYQAMANDYDKV